jgi:uncharacterized protein (TIGR03083 family)
MLNAMDRIAIIDSESQRFADVLSAADPDAPCPTCPDWTAADLLWHLVNVHLFWAAVLSRGIIDEADVPAIEADKPARPADVADLLVLREQATAALCDQLAERADGEPCWSWWPPDQTVGFTRRMQTYEATMHRIDAELAAGVPVGAIAADVAAGAVDHAVDVMWGWMPDEATYQPGAVVEFVASDADARWLVELGSWTVPAAEPADDAVSAPMAVRAIAGAPTAVVSAPVADLALWAWTRGGAVTISGEPAAKAALDALMAQGIQ